MTQTLGTLTHVKLSDIIPDPEQPRKLFTAERLAELKASITKYGLRTPLIVTKRPDGKYDIVDGERRWRVLTSLKVALVPTHVIEVGTKLERLIEQFNIQETHQGWTPTEKASVVIALATEAKMTVTEMCQTLNIPHYTVSRYIAYGSLVNKEKFDRANVPIEMAKYIVATKNVAKNIYHDELKEEFTRTDDRKLEQVLIDQIVSGDIKNRSDFSKIKNSFKKEPKSVTTYLAAKTTPEALFLKTKAQGQQHLSNAAQQASFLKNSLARYLETPDVQPNSETIARMKRVVAIITTFLKKVE